MTDKLSFPTTEKLYEIRVKGHLEPRRLSLFEALSVSHQPNGETLLVGPLSDQAALYGLLNRLRDLGVPLLAVNPVERPKQDIG